MAVFTFFPLNQNEIRFTLELRKSETRNQRKPEDVEHTKLTEQLVVDLIGSVSFVVCIVESPFKHAMKSLEALNLFG